MADMLVNISIWRYFATYDGCGYVTWLAHMMVDNKLDIDRYDGRYYGRYGGNLVDVISILDLLGALGSGADVMADIMFLFGFHFRVFCF